MKNGGYVMVDCKGLDLIKGSTPQTIPGIYEDVQKAMKTGKEILACNCVWDTSLDVTPISVMAIQINATTVICTAATLQVIITSSDVITINNLVE